MWGKLHLPGEVPRKKVNTLKISKKGYMSKSFALNTEIESTFWVNLLSGGPFGSTTDSATGSMWKISPNTYNVDLERKGLGE